jgi:hypothetical protein
LPALAPYIERDDFRVQLKTPIHMPSGKIIADVPGIFMRFPKWSGEPFVDDFGKKAAGMVELDGEHTFAELQSWRCCGCSRRTAGAAAGSTRRARARKSGSI